VKDLFSRESARFAVIGGQFNDEEYFFALKQRPETVIGVAVIGVALSPYCTEMTYSKVGISKVTKMHRYALRRTILTQCSHCDLNVMVLALSLLELISMHSYFSLRFFIGGGNERWGEETVLYWNLQERIFSLQGDLWHLGELPRQTTNCCTGLVKMVNTQKRNTLLINCLIEPSRRAADSL